MVSSNHHQVPWASNVVPVRKADNSLRFCVDYRKLNLLSVKDSYPLPRTDTCFDALGGAKFFSTLDLQSAYWQVENHPDSMDKTSFVTRRGTFRFRVFIIWFVKCSGGLSETHGFSYGRSDFGNLSCVS